MLGLERVERSSFKSRGRGALGQVARAGLWSLIFLGLWMQARWVCVLVQSEKGPACVSTGARMLCLA